MSETGCVTSRDEEPLGWVLEAELAVQRNEVTFPMVMKTLRVELGQPTHLPYRDLYRQVLSQFMDAHGGIAESFYADEFYAGTLLTQKGELFFNIWWDKFNFATTKARALEADINDLRLKAELYLPQDHRWICMGQLFRLYKSLISSLCAEWYRCSGEERGKEPSEAHVADLKELRQELKGITEMYRSAGLTRGQVRYVKAAALGTALIVGLAGIAAAIAGTANSRIWLGVIAGGAVGALLSVLERLTRGALGVQFETDNGAMTISGISRPVVGALSGMALVVLVKGNIVLPPLGKATETDYGLFFVVGIAFLAGFSERLVKDVLGNATSSLDGAQQDSSAANGVAKRSSEDVAKALAD